MGTGMEPLGDLVRMSWGEWIEAPRHSAMDEKQLEAQSRLLIELGEPETWLETMLRASRRSASHEASVGNEELARRWRTLTRGLEYAIAATVHDPITDGTDPRSESRSDQSPSDLEQTDTATQSQANPTEPQHAGLHDSREPYSGQPLSQTDDAA